MSGAGDDGFHGALPLAALLAVFAMGGESSLSGILGAVTQPAVLVMMLVVLVGAYR